MNDFPGGAPSFLQRSIGYKRPKLLFSEQVCARKRGFQLKPFIERELREARLNEMHKLSRFGKREREFLDSLHRTMRECSEQIQHIQCPLSRSSCVSAPWEDEWEGQGTVSLRRDIPCAVRKWDSSTKFLAPSGEGVAEASDQTKEEPNGNWDSLFRRESSDLRWYCKTSNCGPLKK